MQPVTFADVLRAKQRLRPHLARTPLHSYPALNAFIDAQVYVKHENYQPVGAFKVRGGINYLSQLPAEARERGVVTASTGNHGQSIAYASRLFGVPAHIVVPERSNPGKVAAIRGMGAQIIEHGSTFDEARLHCEELSRTKGYTYIHSANEPLLIAGVATETLEMLEDEPDLQAVAKLGLAHLGASPEKGAKTSLYLASSPEVEHLTGRYFANCQPTVSSPGSYDTAAQQRLWQESACLVHLPDMLSAKAPIV